MNPNMAFYAVDTKIKTKKGHILNSKDWKKFIECNSIEQLENMLKNNIEIGKAFEGAKVSSSRRINLETVIIKLRKIEIENMLHYFSESYKDFLKNFLLEEEIHDLSLIIRMLSRGESLKNIDERFIHSNLYTSLNFDELVASKTVEQLIDKLNGSIYYEGLKSLTVEDALNREFHVEMKLYAALYKAMYESADKLGKDDKGAAEELIGLRIDLLNIQWIYRALKYYKISPEEMFIYSLEGGKDIGYKELKSLCYSKSTDEFINMVDRYLKHDFFNDLNSAEIDINGVVDSYMYNYLRSRHYTGIGTAISFIYLLNIVINDLTSIIEGIRYDVPREELKGYMVYKI